ncbi:MAG: hypothetical protein WD056_00920 [Gemmatimonadota bacterium]
MREPSGGAGEDTDSVAVADAARGGRGHQVLRLAVKVAAVAALVAAAIWVNLFGSELTAVEDMVSMWGFPGLFLLSALSGFNLVIPIPIILFYPFFVEIGMHPVATVLTISVGMTTGDLAGFLVGSLGREVVQVSDGRVLGALRRLQDRWWLPYLILFVYASVVPLPNELLVIPMAFLGFSLFGIFGATFLGNFIFNGLAALGLLGIFGSG